MEQRNYVEIHGCSTCPFLKYRPYMHCYFEIDVYNKYDTLNTKFPQECPLRDPNFKLIRRFDKENEYE